MRATKAFLFAVVAVLFVFSGSAQAYRDVIDLGTLGNYENSGPYYINNSGQIVGWAGNDPLYGRACLFDKTGGGANTNLGTLGGSRSAAHSINDSGQIVGWAFDSFNSSRASLFDPTGGGANIDLGTLGGPESVAFSINNSGQVVGWAKIEIGFMQFYWRACLFDPTGGGANIDLGTLGGDESVAYSINGSGQIVGWVENGSGYDRACLFDPTGGWDNIDLGALPDNQHSRAFCISDIGQIVGEAGGNACLFDPTGGGANTDLGSGTAYFINDIGQIVGEAGGNACLFDPSGGGSNIDLNTLIDPSSGWTLERAYSINNDGWIVGVGINPEGYEHAYLLIPEPTSVLILGLGGVFLALRRNNSF